MPTAKVPAHLRCDYGFLDAVAIRAWAEGNASEEQMKRSFDWVLRHAAWIGVGRLSMTEDDRTTSFMLGRNYVGQKLIEIVQLAPAHLEKLRPAKT